TKYINNHTRYKTASKQDVTFEATFFCDGSISEFEVRFSYPWEDHFFVLCGPSSGSTAGVWQTKKKTFSCLSAQGCSEIELWMYGITVAPGNIVGLQNLQIITDDSTFPPAVSTTPHTATTVVETTTESATTSNPETTTDSLLTTASMPHTTTSASPIVTTPAGSELSCYSCINCPEVDENTQVVQTDEYKSCVTTQFDQTYVVRGGSEEYHEEDECNTDNENMIECFCSSNLCNNV
ncbi:unnamed protein product, partial [Meganyctiphanes norvegica]